MRVGSIKTNKKPPTWRSGYPRVFIPCLDLSHRKAEFFATLFSLFLLNFHPFLTQFSFGSNLPFSGVFSNKLFFSIIKRQLWLETLAKSNLSLIKGTSRGTKISHKLFPSSQSLFLFLSNTPRPAGCFSNPKSGLTAFYAPMDPGFLVLFFGDLGCIFTFDPWCFSRVDLAH